MASKLGCKGCGKQPIRGRRLSFVVQEDYELNAEYKGMDIWIYKCDSGRYKGQWSVYVTDMATGLHAVDNIYKKSECPTIVDALKKALEGAML
jgi:hypothetical protein